MSTGKGYILEEKHFFKIIIGNKFASFLLSVDTAFILRVLSACGGKASSISWNRNSSGFLTPCSILEPDLFECFEQMVWCIVVTQQMLVGWVMDHALMLIVAKWVIGFSHNLAAFHRRGGLIWTSAP